jgi:hypothetical protein
MMNFVEVLLIIDAPDDNAIAACTEMSEHALAAEMDCSD